MSSSSAFNPSRIRRDGEPKVERVGKGMYTFSDAYEGDFQFFSDRPITIETPRAEDPKAEPPKTGKS